ncbi:hypothetical protein [Aeromicrobium stalagmiti]|uniref:hypothetical protein n=1 Tax=Aeromicrobium stalagmiti TaxID=2738988 RepID=UPI001569F792|nr:hypothetical protein [Aeromicrobium stalagmiti]NRQ49268.1 hypothetical protein [Aeromicrobium stalagmiti]
MRRRGVVVVVMMIGSLFGCGASDSGGDEPAKAEQRADATRAAAKETFPLVGDAVKALTYTSGGSGRWAICGMEPSPSGAEYAAEVAVTQSDTAASEQAELIASALTSAGWKVDETTSEAVTASKGGLAFRARYGDGGINLSITSGCVDVSKDRIRALTDEPSEDLGLPQP